MYKRNKLQQFDLSADLSSAAQGRFTPNRFIVQVATLLFVLAFAATVGSLLSLLNSQASVARHVSLWEEDIAKNLLLKGDATLLDKVKSQIPDVTKDVSTVLTFGLSQEVSPNEQTCSLRQLIPITLYGTPSGQILVCRTYWSLIQVGVQSPVFFILSFLGVFFLFWRHRRIETEEARLRSAQATAAAIESLAKQVAHDIRSPVGALQIVGESLSSHAELLHFRSHFELLDSAIKRITHIADELLNKNTSQDLNQINATVLWTTLSSIINEKKLVASEDFSEDFADIGLRVAGAKELEGLQAQHVDAKLGRVLSNLIQNAIEAPRREGVKKTVEVILNLEDSKHLQVSINDNGIGLDRRSLRSLGKQGFSLGKKRGNGLGVWHARNWVSSRGGRLIYESAPDHGTCVKINLPR